MPSLTDIAKNKRSKKLATGTKKPATRAASSDVPWQKISNLYNDGKTTAEISDELKLTRPKTKDGKVNQYPYYLVVGYLTKLSNGVVVNDKTIKIERGSKPAKKSAAA